jgi:hypothetical protein
MRGRRYFSMIGQLVTDHPELLLPIMENTVQKVSAMNITFRLYMN